MFNCLNGTKKRNKVSRVVEYTGGGERNSRTFNLPPQPKPARVDFGTLK